MNVLIINPPYLTATAKYGTGHQVPLGLLMVGGALIDDGHDVRLLDAEALELPLDRILADIDRCRPDVVLIGHAGSTPAHGICCQLFTAIKAAYPAAITIYGGVYPTYHPNRILTDVPYVDFIVRGEGESTIVALLDQLSQRAGSAEPAAWELLQNIPGIAFRGGAECVVTRPAKPIENLDRYRIGWELLDNWDLYQCFGLGRAAIIQLSRGCPHQCTYCGQHDFWMRWRHRDPRRVADEVEWLYRRHDVRFITLADENPTTLRTVWTAFLEELRDRRLPVYLFATIRATDIVRDRDQLSLWREAGLLYILLGIESTDAEVIKQIRKGSTPRIDYEACRLLKKNRILSILGHVVGLAEDSASTFRTARKQLALYDGDFLNAMYVTPHTWTVFGKEMSGKGVIEPEQSKWDYRHQVLEQERLSMLELFLHVKWLEVCFHLRPSKLWRDLTHSDSFLRRQYRWTLVHTAGVALAEAADFFTCYTRRRSVRPLAAFEDKTGARPLEDKPARAA